MDSEVVSALLNPQSINDNGGENSTVSFTKIFYNHLPFYLALGMTWDEYWNEDVCRVIYYRKMYDYKKEMSNENYWLQGAYFYQALCAASPLFRSLAKRPKAQPYLKEPIAITERMIKEKEEKDAKEKYNKILNKMKTLANINNK